MHELFRQNWCAIIGTGAGLGNPLLVRRADAVCQVGVQRASGETAATAAAVLGASTGDSV